MEYVTITLMFQMQTRRIHINSISGQYLAGCEDSVGPHQLPCALGCKRQLRVVELQGPEWLLVIVLCPPCCWLLRKGS